VVYDILGSTEDYCYDVKPSLIINIAVFYIVGSGKYYCPLLGYIGGVSRINVEIA
jgi:hypothetical protein